MNEDFLHYLWKFKHLRGFFQTEEGLPVRVIDAGSHNKHAGPDFNQAKIYIGNTLWAGHVEIHLKSSDWYLHKHHQDPAYDNVILHVVHEYDKPVFRENGECIPCLCIKNLYNPELLERYRGLLENMQFIPCQQQISGINNHFMSIYLEKMAIERLSLKYHEIIHQFQNNRNAWDETCYQYLLAGFGLKNNYENFMLLAKSLPLKFLSKHKNNLFQIEAMLFGQAGLLQPYFIGKYPNELKKEYTFLQNKFCLTPLNSKIWKFFRQRPSSFPTIRISLFADLLHHSSHLFRKMLDAKQVDEISVLLQAETGDYWHSHYLFDKPADNHHRNLGESAKQLIIINIIIPFLFSYGKYRQETVYQEKALDWLNQLNPERHQMIHAWENIGIKPCNAVQSQALVHLQKHYCSRKKCLSCDIGIKILNLG